MHACLELGAERKMFNSFVIVIGKVDEEKEIWVVELLLFCLCFLRRQMEGTELLFVRYMESYCL